MNLNELIKDTRTSFTDATRALVDTDAFRRDLVHLKRFSFWDPHSGNPALWQHQRAAISTVVAYLNGDKALPERPEHNEAALLKLPTGTGKSGIIAILARCLPNVRRILVLTPRTALTEQLLSDIRFRFWNHLGYETEGKALFTAEAGELGADLENAFVEQLLPSKVQALVEHLESKDVDRAILVGTHQALSDIRKQAHTGGDAFSGLCQQLLTRISDEFDLVIVDEGHYEPAVSWSRGVREFNLPTVLLSATPYRNDYKSFRVRGRYLFNYPYHQAVEERIIRPVEIVVPDAVGAQGRNAAIAQFVQILHQELPGRLGQTPRWFRDAHTTPKVMVRGDDLDTLELLQSAIDAAFDTQSVLIHDRAKKSPENGNRFSSVASAIRERSDAQFWVHQNKLMEGIDDPSFVAVAIFDLMGNSRQLVQQIGRATRYSKGDRRFNQTGWVIGSPANAARIQTAWERYKGFEEYAANNTANIVTNEVTLPDRLLQYMAEYQYVSGEFRARFEYEAPLAAGDVQLPLSAAVLNTVVPLRDIGVFVDIVEEAIMDKDRFKITPIDGMPEKAVGFSYYAWRNSPYLIDRFFSEWKLGIFIAVKQDEFVFMHDTEGLVVDMAGLGLERAGRSMMEKSFPQNDYENTARLSRMSFSSLDMSQNSIRGLALRTRSFADVFTDLLDPSLVPSTAAGFVNGSARYVGFARSRLRDASERYLPIAEYVAWTAEVADELSDDNRARSGVFGRYAAVVEGITKAEAQPVSILLDPSQDSFIDMREDEAVAGAIIAQDDVDYLDLCADVDPANGEFKVKIGEEEVDCSIEYRDEIGKYRLASGRLNELFPARERDDRRQGQTLVQRLNQAQAFRIVTSKDGVVYSEGVFFEPRTQWVQDGSKPILDYIEAAPSLTPIDSEKGEAYFGNADWYRRSIFGLFSATCEGQRPAHQIADDALTSAVERYSIWLCDDDNQEVADFIGVDPEHKNIVLVHAKVGDQGPGGHGFNVGGLQVVGRQALASLGFISRGQPSPVWSAARWDSDVQANAVALVGRNRIFGNRDNLNSAELNEALRAASRNPSFNKELWIVAAKMTRREVLDQGLDQNPTDNRLRQFLMHWDAMQTACARANTRLRFFCT